ncbi:dihydrolipoyl dehydrogenase [Rummeliibacillus sp. JY-2-4R]
MRNFDLTIIGAGPGGYVAAIHAAKLGLSVALIERKKVGGTCLNVGCIPSKVMLKHSHLAMDIQKANSWGIDAKISSVNFEKLKKRKDQVVNSLVQGVEGLIKKNAITLFSGEATVDRRNTVYIEGKSFHSKDIILATGSRPFVPPIKGLETIDYETTDTFFDLEELPKKLVIIGGGVIAVELAFSLAPLGTDVTILEVAKDILLTEDEDARNIIKLKMDKIGIKYKTNTEIKSVHNNEVVLNDETINFTNLLVATGRQPNVEIAEVLNLKMDGKFVKVNQHYETSQNHIFAIGDLIGGYQLAHAASAEGIHAVEYIHSGQAPALNAQSIPRCVYTIPEIASFGYSEEQANSAGYKHVKVKKLPLATNGKAMAEGNTEGFIKIIADQEFGEILGTVVVGEGATEMMNSILALYVAEGTIHELSNVIFPHPSISEQIGETADALLGTAIHA